MERFRTTFSGDFDDWVEKIEKGMLNSSITTTLEGSWDSQQGDARCAVRVFERYIYRTKNRVSMNVTLFQNEGLIQLCAITSGGSHAMFFRGYSWAEEKFLDVLKEIVR